MKTVRRCCSRTGLGTGCTISTVSSSMRRGLPSRLAYWRICELGCCARSMENTTSSAVNGVPSWNLTPARREKRHVVSLTWVHERARPGTMLSCLSRITSVSCTCCENRLVSPSFCENGSAVCGSPAEVQRNGLASAPAAARTPAAATSANSALMITSSRDSAAPARLALLQEQADAFARLVTPAGLHQHNGRMGGHRRNDQRLRHAGQQLPRARERLRPRVRELRGEFLHARIQF